MSNLHPLPSLLSVASIQERLSIIFPESFPDRSILVGDLAAKVIYVFLYGGFIAGHDRYLRPSYIYFFTEEQSHLISDQDRVDWLSKANKSGYRHAGKRWYADTSRESIRDDLMRNQLLRLGIMQKLSGVATTSSKPINFITGDFAALFDPNTNGDSLKVVCDAWRNTHLDKATQQRMALKAKGIHASPDDLLVDMPDKTRIRISAGPSSLIAKGLIEDFAVKHLESPAVLWFSASDKKSYPQFVEIASQVGLTFDLNAVLPDLIIADLKNPVRFIFCEIVATDGSITEARKQLLLNVVRGSDIPEECVEFLTAFEDRGAYIFKKNFSQLAVNSLVWFRTEPELLVSLETASEYLS